MTDHESQFIYSHLRSQLQITNNLCFLFAAIATVALSMFLLK